MLFRSSLLDELYKEKEINIENVDISKVWLLENVHCLRGQIERLCKARNSYQQGNIKFESGSIDTLLHVVDMNPGITIIPEMHAMGLREYESPSQTIKCWIYPNRYGKLNIIDGIKNSCNVYFSEMGHRLSSDTSTGEYNPNITTYS